MSLSSLLIDQLSALKKEEFDKWLIRFRLIDEEIKVVKGEG